MSDDPDRPSIFRVGGVSYLRIPASDPRRAGAFYERVFGWTLHGDADEPGFDDATGRAIGHFVRDLDVAGEAGGDLWVATFRDPSGNVVGVWHRGPRFADSAT